MIPRSVSTARFTFTVVAMCVMFLAVALRASAGAVSSCEMPIVFEGAEVNVVVLPYFQSGSSPRELNGLGFNWPCW